VKITWESSSSNSESESEGILDEELRAEREM